MNLKKTFTYDLSKIFKAGSGGIASVSNPCGSTSKGARVFLYATYYTCKRARIIWGFIIHPKSLLRLFQKRRMPKSLLSKYFYQEFLANSGLMQPTTAKYLGESKAQTNATK